MTRLYISTITANLTPEYRALPKPHPGAVAYVPEGAADALAWRLRSYAVHDDNCKINKPPHFRDCSCGLKKLLDSMEPIDGQR